MPHRSLKWEVTYRIGAHTILGIIYDLFGNGVDRCYVLFSFSQLLVIFPAKPFNYKLSPEPRI